MSLRPANTATLVLACRVELIMVYDSKLKVSSWVNVTAAQCAEK
jgi:hypothetical protein